MKAVTTARLRQDFEPIANVPEEQLQYLIDNSKPYELKEDEFLFQKGQPSDHMNLILSGRIRIYSQQKNQSREIAILEKGDITGLLPYSRLTHAQGSGQALETSVILAFHRENMPAMIRNNYELTEALVHFMSSRIREFTTFQLQNEKMMALGKLSAGLAHELNNPASAIVRSSKELKSHLGHLPQNFKKVISIRMTPEQVDEVNEMLTKRLSQPPGKKLSLMDRQDLEDDLADCMGEKGVDNAYEVAENLIEFGFQCSELEAIYERTSADHFAPVIKWVNDNLTTERMVREIEDASTRIANLVSSVKNFTHMDRTPDKIKADIHEGIENTLVMLNHKLRKNGIRVERKFQDDLPQPKVLVSELNQVWTNLIDNAIDVMEHTENPVLSLETRQDREFVRVVVRDNGPGIPDDIKNNIFDPFFTTKEIGKGTGLGLEVVKNIVNKHNGTIKVESVPGNTEFEVCLPLN